MDETLSSRIENASNVAAKLAIDPEFNDKCSRNGALLAEIDPENTLGLAGVGVTRLTMAGLTEVSFEKAVQILKTDRHTSLDEVLELVNKKS